MCLCTAYINYLQDDWDWRGRTEKLYDNHEILIILFNVQLFVFVYSDNTFAIQVCDNHEIIIVKLIFFFLFVYKSLCITHLILTLQIFVRESRWHYLCWFLCCPCFMCNAAPFCRALLGSVNVTHWNTNKRSKELHRGCPICHISSTWLTVEPIYVEWPPWSLSIAATMEPLYSGHHGASL